MLSDLKLEVGAPEGAGSYHWQHRSKMEQGTWRSRRTSRSARRKRGTERGRVSGGENQKGEITFVGGSLSPAVSHVEDTRLATDADDRESRSPERTQVFPIFLVTLKHEFKLTGTLQFVYTHEQVLFLKRR